MTEEFGVPLRHEAAPVQPSESETATAPAGAGNVNPPTRGLLGQPRGMLNQQVRARQQQLASRLHGFAKGFSASNDSDVVPADLARRAAGGIHGVANWLEERQPADLAEEVRAFARRRPGVAVLAATMAGLAAGRLRQWMKDIRRR